MNWSAFFGVLGAMSLVLGFFAAMILSAFAVEQRFGVWWGVATAVGFLSIAAAIVAGLTA